MCEIQRTIVGSPTVTSMAEFGVRGTKEGCFQSAGLGPGFTPTPRFKVAKKDRRLRFAPARGGAPRDPRAAPA